MLWTQRGPEDLNPRKREPFFFLEACVTSGHEFRIERPQTKVLCLGKDKPEELFHGQI